MSNNEPVKIGEIKADVIATLKLDIEENTPIMIGESNVNHIRDKHPQDYANYGKYIPLILSSPDYVGRNPKNDSIEYVKEFKMGKDYVKVAVRVSQSGIYFVRSMYILNPKRVKNFMAKGSLKHPLTKSDE